MKGFNDTVRFPSCFSSRPCASHPGQSWGSFSRCMTGRSPALREPFSPDPSQQEGAESPISNPLLHINSNITFKLKISFFPAWCASK